MVVGVHLVDCTIELALGTYRHLHCNSRYDLLEPYGVDLPAHPPLLSLEVEVVDPRLVQVYDAGIARELVQHEDSKMLSKQKTASGLPRNGTLRTRLYLAPTS